MQKKSLLLLLLAASIGTNAQNVGIGTTTPQTRLHVFNGASGAIPFAFSPLAIEGNGHTYINLLSPAVNETAILFGQPGSSANGVLMYNNESTHNGFQFRNNGNITRMVIDSAGNVGIGTISPFSRLHVADSSVVFSASGPASLTPGNPPISGAGRRMMWYADKGAFRAGYVNTPAWDKAFTGEYSAAFGLDNRASGYASFSTGNSNRATGNTSTALGYGSIADAEYSTSIGLSAWASGYASFAAGNTNRAMGYSSTAFGFLTRAGGDYSTSIGFSTNANGNYSTAMGYLAIASGTGAIAMGYSTTSSNDYSTSMGYSTKALGLYSTAMGNLSIASGNAALATGQSTNASGTFSTAMGHLGQANAEISVAIGGSVIANAWASTSLGMYNDPIITSPTTGWVLTEPLLIVGNGTGGGDKKNALVILKNGNVGLGGSNTPDAPLTLKSGFGKRINIFTGGSGHVGMSVQPGNLQIYGDIPSVAIGLGYQQNSLISVENPTGFQYNLNVFGDGNAELRGILTQHSDARFKTNILPIASSLSSLLKLNGYSYNWKDKTLDSAKQIGLIAQEVQKLFPELVKENKQGELSVNYSGLIPVLITAMKEQQQQIDALSTHDKEQQKKLVEMQKQMDELIKFVHK